MDQIPKRIPKRIKIRSAQQPNFGSSYPTPQLSNQEMEVLKPTTSGSTNFRLNSSATAPMSPRLFGGPFDYQFHYTSASNSPTRAASIYSHFSAYDNDDSGELFDFAFYSGTISASLQLTEISSADELFEKGKIRPLKLPSAPQAERGRQRSTFSASPRNRSSCGGESRKCRLRDLLFFRSASEGRATGRESRDPLRKYALFPSYPPRQPAKGKKEVQRIQELQICGKHRRVVKERRGGRWLRSTSFITRQTGRRRWS